MNIEFPIPESILLQKLGIHRDTALKWRKEGTIKGYKFKGKRGVFYYLSEINQSLRNELER